MEVVAGQIDEDRLFEQGCDFVQAFAHTNDPGEVTGVAQAFVMGYFARAFEGYANDWAQDDRVHSMVKRIAAWAESLNP